MFHHRFSSFEFFSVIAASTLGIVLLGSRANAQLVAVVEDDYESYATGVPDTPVAPYDFSTTNIATEVVAGAGVDGSNALRIRYDVADQVTHNAGIRYNLPAMNNESSNLSKYTLSFDVALGAGSVTTGFFQNRIEMFVPGTNPAQQQGWPIDYNLLTPGDVDADTPGAYQHYEYTLDTGPPIFDGNVQVDPTSDNFDFAFVFLGFPSTVTATNTVFIDNLKIEIAPPPVVDLTLLVNKDTEEIKIRNDSANPVSFDYYAIESSQNALDPAGWNSLDEQDRDFGLATDFNGNGTVDSPDLADWASSYGVDDGGDADRDGDTDGSDFLAWQSEFGNMPGPTNGWIEAGGSTAAKIGELFLDGATVLGPGEEVSLGAAYNKSVFGTADGDLVFNVSTGESTALGLGSVVYESGAAVAVPEPGAIVLWLGTLSVFSCKRRRRNERRSPM